MIELDLFYRLGSCMLVCFCSPEFCIRKFIYYLSYSLPGLIGQPDNWSVSNDFVFCCPFTLWEWFQCLMICFRSLVQAPNRRSCMIRLCLLLWMKYLRDITALSLLMVKKVYLSLYDSNLYVSGSAFCACNCWYLVSFCRMGNFLVMLELFQELLNRFLIY